MIIVRCNSFWDAVEKMQPKAIVYPINAHTLERAYGKYYLKGSVGISLQIEKLNRGLRTEAAERLMFEGNMPAIIKTKKPYDIILFPIRDAFLYFSINTKVVENSTRKMIDIVNIEYEGINPKILIPPFTVETKRNSAILSKMAILDSRFYYTRLNSAANYNMI